MMFVAITIMFVATRGGGKKVSFLSHAEREGVCVCVRVSVA